MRLIVYTIAVLGLTGAARADSPMSPCGNSVVVQRDDTLSAIADRCNLSEGALIAHNPEVQGSNDLAVGMKLKVEKSGTSGQSVDTQLNLFGRQANDALGSLAGAIGTSTQDLLDRNPDLRSRVDKVKNVIGLGNDAEHATISIAPSAAAAGSQVTLTAANLPKDSPVSIGAGLPGSAYEIIANARSSSDGTLTTSITVPAWLKGLAQAVFVIVGSGHDVEARSGKITLTP